MTPQQTPVLALRVAHDDEGEVVRRIADLDNDEFDVRERDHQALADQGQAALPSLCQSLARRGKQWERKTETMTGRSHAEA